MLRRLCLFLLLTVGVLAGLLASCQPAAAATFVVHADGTTTVASTFGTAGVLSMLVGTLLPLIVGAVTRLTLNAGVKALLLLLLSAITAVLTQWLTALNNAQAFHWQAAVLSAFTTFAVGAGAHYQLWKPSGLAQKVGVGGIVPTPELQPGNLDLAYSDYTLVDDDQDAAAAASQPARVLAVEGGRHEA